MDGAAASACGATGGSASPAMTRPARSELSVRDYRPGDEPAIVAMFRSMLGDRSIAEWEWLFLRGPGGPAMIGVLESEGRPVGSDAHIPVWGWVQGRRVRLAIGCALMIHPEFRGQGGGEKLLKSFLAREQSADVNFGCVNEASGRLMKQHMPQGDVGMVPQWVRRTTRDTKRFTLLTSAAERLYGRLVSWPRPNVAVVELLELGTEVDELADESASFAPCIRVRDATYLCWHWIEGPDQKWRFRAARDPDGRLRGLVVIGARNEGDCRRGIVADVLVRDEQALRALLLDAWDRLLEDGCDSVTCVYQDPRPWARRALRRSGFRPGPGPIVACGPLSSAAGPIAGQLEAWYVTGGDTDI